MTEFDELRLEIQPDIHNPTSWSVHVEKCPRDEYKIDENTVLKVSRDDLKLLRNATAAPNLGALRELGKNVIDSIMPPQLQTGLRVCVTDALGKDRGLRLVVSLIGDERPPGGIRNHELPLEAIFHQQLAFLGNNIRTPISRGIAKATDRAVVAVQAPLKVLVVASEPSDMPSVNAAAEKAAILEALQHLIASNAVRVDFCEPPTFEKFAEMVQGERYHVVHFIGHGDFQIVSDPAPQPHLYFVDGTPNRWRKPADIEQLFGALRNGNIPLVVLTACSTAASSPNGEDYPVAAFESLAHGLVKRDWGPSAVIAMQFDLETQAAVVFSRALYSNLLNHKFTLDEAVAAARNALLAVFGAGHRSWVNPTVYSRCQGGRLFKIQDVTGELSADDQKKIIAIDTLIEEYEKQISEMAEKSASEQAALATLRADWQLKIQELLRQRGFILGSTVRLRGGIAAADGIVECSLTIQLRLPAKIGDMKVSAAYDSVDLDYVDRLAGKDVPEDSIFLQQNAGQLSSIMVRNASQGQTWPSNEYELCKLRFKVKNPNNKPLLYISITGAQVERNGQTEQLQTLNATVFGS